MAPRTIAKQKKRSARASVKKKKKTMGAKETVMKKENETKNGKDEVRDEGGALSDSFSGDDEFLPSSDDDEVLVTGGDPDGLDGKAARARASKVKDAGTLLEEVRAFAAG